MYVSIFIFSMYYLSDGTNYYYKSLVNQCDADEETKEKASVFNPSNQKFINWDFMSPAVLDLCIKLLGVQLY